MRIASLDGLRGVFALFVVAFHYDEFAPSFITESFFVRESWIFVEFFFVLSGYVIAMNYNHLETIQNFLDYLKKRFIRLYPLLLYTTVVYLGVELLANTFLSQVLLEPKTLPFLCYQTLDTLTFMNSTPIFGNSLGMNGPSWSISAEMIAYCIFGIVSISKVKPNWLSIILILGAGTLLMIHSMTDLFEGLHLDFLRGILSFFLGVTIFRAKNKQMWMPNRVEVLIPILVLASMFALHHSLGVWNAFHSTVTINLVFFFSITTLTRTNGFLSHLLKSEPIQTLGKLSYSIYLNHLLVITVVPRVWFQLFECLQTSFSELVVFLVSLSLTILYSNCTYTFVEQAGGKRLRALVFPSDKAGR